MKYILGLCNFESLLLRMVNFECSVRFFRCLWFNIQFAILFSVLQFAKIDAKKAEEAKRREKPVEINEWDDEEKEKCQMYVDQNDVENGQNGQKEPNGNEAEATA